MKSCFMVFAAVAYAVWAQDVVLSKDSLWVCNNNMSSRIDMVTLTNNGPDQVGIDSIGVHFSELDTAGLLFIFSNNRFDAALTEIYHGTGVNHYETMKQAGDREYDILFVASSKRPFVMNASGDSVTLANLQFGSCFICSSLPSYPKYLKGMLRFYFNNGEVDTLRFYSDDLRPINVRRATPVRQQEVANRNGAHYLINGRKIPVKPAAENRKRIMHRMYEIESSK